MVDRKINRQMDRQIGDKQHKTSILVKGETREAEAID